MMTGTGGEPRSGTGAAVDPVEAVPVEAVPIEAVPAEGPEVPPSRRRIGAERVRRPADLLLAVFALAVAVVVLGTIRALPLGSTEVADDVSGWLLHIPAG